MHVKMKYLLQIIFLFSFTPVLSQNISNQENRVKSGDLTFEEKEFNDIDNLVFSMLAYLNYTDTSINIKNHTIEYIAHEYFKLNKYSDVRRLGIAQRDAYKMLSEVVKTKRYKDLIIHDYL